MKVKLDENLPARLGARLQQLGHDVDTVASEGLQGAQGAVVWAAARTDGRFFITQDLDFADRRAFAPGTHAGLLLVRLRAPGATALMRRMESALAVAPLESLGQCVAVLTDTRLRINRP